MFKTQFVPLDHSQQFPYTNFVPKKILIFCFLLLALSVEPVLARDPYPNKARIQYMVAPGEVEDPYNGPSTNPESMIRTDGLRSDIISFSCYKAGATPEKIYKNDLSVDSAEKVSCDAGRTVFPPLLKNNKNTPECQGKLYDANCYSFPIGQFLGRHPKASHAGWEWVTPLVYGTIPNGGLLHDSRCNNGICDCGYQPTDPAHTASTWVRLTWGTRICYAPPYITSGSWWTWYLGQLNSLQGKVTSETVAVNVYLGIDGEGRPLKSQDSWDAGFNINSRFNNEYVPKVISEVKSRYGGKTIRSMADEQLVPLYLNNDIDFHRESLESDERNAYLYKGIGTWGWWQGFANYFYITNTLGLAQAWPPTYQTVLSGLAKHTDGITGIPIDGSVSQDFLKFTGSYIGKNINDTPGVWIYLRDTTHKKEGTNVSGKYGDYDYYLYRPENLENNHTEAVSADVIRSMAPDTASQIYSFNGPVFGVKNQYVGRRNTPGNSYMSFDIDDGYLSQAPYSIRIVYLDEGTGDFYFEYKDSSDNQRRETITKQNTHKWQEKKLENIPAKFKNNMSSDPAYPADFRLNFTGTPQTIIHLIEVRGQKLNLSRPKAQISCEINNNPYSIGLNQNIEVKAVLTDSNGQFLANQRVMMTYNTEWNYAKSQNTNSQGVAILPLNTANNQNSSGFMGAESDSRPDKASMYSIQAYFPGSESYQPSRNDCYIAMTNSSGPSDSRNTKIVITNIDKTSNPKEVKVTYNVVYNSGAPTLNKTESLGKSRGYYSDDPNSQTLYVVYYDRNYHPSTANFTINGAPPDPNSYLHLAKNFNYVTAPNTSIPQDCKATQKKSGIFNTKNFIQGSKIFLRCSQPTTW